MRLSTEGAGVCSEGSLVKLRRAEAAPVGVPVPAAPIALLGEA